MILGHFFVDLSLGNGVHHLYQMANGPIIYLPAQLDLCFHLIAFGNSHIAHIIAKSDNAQLVRGLIAHGGAHPCGQLVLHRSILPVTGHHLARQAHTSADKAVLTVAMGSLIQVHKVHVDLLVGDLAVILGGQVAIGLLQQIKAVDPHFARGEGVAPGHNAQAVIVMVGILHDLGDLCIGFHGCLIHQLAGQNAAIRHFLGHLCAAGGHRFQHLGAIQELAAYYEPKFFLLHIHLNYPLFVYSLICSTAAFSTDSPAVNAVINFAKPALSASSGAMQEPSCPANTRVCR